MVQNKSVVFKAIPEGFPEEGKHLVMETSDINLDKVPEGGAIAKTLYLSLDPYMRGRMRDAKIRSYTPAFELNKPITSYSISEVVKSSTDQLKVGQLIHTTGPVSEYWEISAQLLKAQSPLTKKPVVDVLENPRNISLANFLGPLGMPGITAYSSFYEIGEPKKGETIYISAAAGAVGAVVGQLAKREGLKVIGSVGEEKKLRYIVDELGFDGGFNYKEEEPAKALKRLAPDGIDIYFENVGGEQLQAAFDRMNDFGRIIACGMISQYNLAPEKQYRLNNLSLFVSRRIRMQGFIQFDPKFAPKWEKEHTERVSEWIADGSFDAKLDMTYGIDNTIKALQGIFKGENFGKAVLEVAKPEHTSSRL